MVSIGLPFRNNYSTLRLALKSIFAQSYSNWELILVDDGSTDGSLDLVRRLESDPRVRVLCDGSNRGLAARLNEISGVASGTLVARMDADDAMHPDRLQKQLKAFDVEDVDLVCSAAFAMTGEGQVYGRKSTDPLPDSQAGFLDNASIVHPTVMARAEWMRANPYNEALLRCQDKELWCRTSGQSKFRKIAEPLLFYREVGNFSLSTYRSTAHFDRRIVGAYGPMAIGRGKTVMKQWASFGKVGLYGLAVALGREDVLISRRVRNLAGADAEDAQTILDRVDQALLPGIG
ncbi:glycosyltransferase family 2 protein [Actinomycetospora sp. C-140]